MKFAFIGLGGVGSWLLHFMAPQLQNNIVDLYDGDMLEEKNLDRANYSYLQPGMNKANAAKLLFSKRFGFDPFRYCLGYVGNEKDLKDEYDYIFISIDDIKARCMLSKAKLNSIRIYGGNEEWEGDVLYEIENSDIYYQRYYNKNLGKSRAEMSCGEIAKLPSGGQTRAINIYIANLMYSLFIFNPKQNIVIYCQLKPEIKLLTHKLGG